MKITRLVALLGAIGAILACGADDSSADGAYYDPYGDFGGGAGSGSSMDASTADAGMSDTVDDTFVAEEPELEEPTTAPPSASDRYVFVVNPSLDTVAKIDSVTLAVTPIPVGREPRIVLAQAGGDRAVVLNVASDTVSIIRAAPAGDEVVDVDIIAACNALVLAPDGRHAIAWFDNGRAVAGDRIGSLQEVALIDLEDERAWAVSVGFNIRGVQFDTAGARAYVITDAGLNVLDLAAIDDDVAVPTVEVAEGDLFAALDREVRVADDGAYAVVRSADVQGIRVVDLATGAAATLDLPAIPTDVDLLADGQTALVALRDVGALATVSLPGVLADAATAATIRDEPDVPTGLVTLASDEELALTYTTVGDDRRIGLVELATGDASALVVRKELRGLLVAPNDRVAVAVHEAGPGVAGAGLDVDTLVESADGLSLVDLESRYAKLVLLPTEPDEFIFTPDGRDLFVMLADDATATREVSWIDLETFAARTVPMDSLPEAIGVVPATGRIFVAQQSATGRITFIDPDTGDVQHVTAFQLNAWID